MAENCGQFGQVRLNAVCLSIYGLLGHGDAWNITQKRYFVTFVLVTRDASVLVWSMESHAHGDRMIVKLR